MRPYHVSNCFGSDQSWKFESWEPLAKDRLKLILCVPSHEEKASTQFKEYVLEHSFDGCVETRIGKIIETLSFEYGSSFKRDHGQRNSHLCFRFVRSRILFHQV